jgi:hypothetical protein
MSFEDFKARLRLWLTDATEQPEDMHALQEQLREHLAGLRAQGLAVPQDLQDLEKALSDQLAYQPHSHPDKPDT